MEPRPEVRDTGSEDHHLRDPGRQDRRGHRAQGQGDQRHPVRDRGGHQRGRRRRDRDRGNRVHGRGRGFGGRAPDQAHTGPAHGRRGCHLPGPGGEYHQVRGVREHPSRPRRAGAHLQARRREAHRQGRGRGWSSARRSRWSSRTSTPTGRSRCFPRPTTLTAPRRPRTAAGSLVARDPALGAAPRLGLRRPQRPLRPRRSGPRLRSRRPRRGRRSDAGRADQRDGDPRRATAAVPAPGSPRRCLAPRRCRSRTPSTRSWRGVRRPGPRCPGPTRRRRGPRSPDRRP